MFLKSMLSVTQVCIICTELSKLHRHREGVAKKSPNPANTKTIFPDLSTYCCTLSVPGLSTEFTKPGAEPDAGCQLSNVGGTLVSDKNWYSGVR